MTVNNFFRTYVLLSSLAIPLLYAEPEAAPNIANFNESGRQRLLSIAAIAQNSNASLNNADAPDVSTTHLSALSGCKTQLGKQYLTDMLTHPVNPEDISEILSNRQNCIKALVENPELKQDVEHYLEDAREQEQEIVTLFSDFFIARTCPKIEQLELMKQQSPLFLAINRTGRTITFAMTNLFLGMSSIAAVLLCDFYFHTTICSGNNCGFCRAISEKWNSWNMQSDAIQMSACSGILATLSGYFLYKNYSSASQKRVKMHALNRLIAIAEKTETLCAENNMQKQFKLQDINTKEGVDLIKSLKKSRYKSKNTKVFDLPAVHSFLYRLYNHQDHLALLFASIAELDAYNALATKELEFQKTK